MSGAEEALQLDPAADEAAPDDPSAAREAELVEKRRMIELRKAELELEELEQHLEERREMTRIRLKLERRKLLTFSSKIRSNVTGSLPDACLSTSLTPDAEKWAVQKRALLNEFEKKGDRSQRRSIAEILRDAHEERDRYDEDKDFGELHLETYVAVMEHCIPAELQRQLQLDYFGKPLTAWVKLCRFHAGPAHLVARHDSAAEAHVARQRRPSAMDSGGQGVHEGVSLLRRALQEKPPHGVTSQLHSDGELSQLQQVRAHHSV